MPFDGNCEPRRQHDSANRFYATVRSTSKMIQLTPRNPAHSETSGARPTVCHVIHCLGVGGAEVLVDQMVRRCSQRYRCVVAVLDDIGPLGIKLREDGFTVRHLHRQPGIDRSCAARLNDFAREQNVQILHAHQYTPFFQAMLSRGLFGSLPVLFTEHGRHFPDVPSRKRSLVNRLLLRRQDRLVGCGESVRQALINNEGLPEHRVEVVYNGVDLDALATSDPDARTRIRQEFGIADDDFLAVQVARLHELKDHQTALRAIDLARRTAPNLKLLVVGDGEERLDIERTIADRNLSSNVILAGTRNDVSSLLAASDAFLLSSISEGIPLTIIEAMAAGLPVVSTRVGGIPEMIRHEESGFLTSPGNEQELAEALIRLVNDRMLRQQMADTGRVEAYRRFSLQSMLDGYDSIYQQMLNRV